MNMPLSHLIMLRVGQDHLAGVETDGPDWSTLEVIAEMEAEKAGSVENSRGSEQ